jgi:hypothetical protein
MRGGLFSLPQVAICVDFGEGIATRDVAPGKPQGFSPQRLSRHAAPRLRTRCQIQFRDGRRRGLLCATHRVPPASLRAFLLSQDRHNTAPRQRRLREGLAPRDYRPRQAPGRFTAKGSAALRVRRKIRRQYRFRDGLRRDERGAARQEHPSSLRAFHLIVGGRRSASRHRRLGHSYSPAPGPFMPQGLADAHGFGGRAGACRPSRHCHSSRQ